MTRIVPGEYADFLEIWRGQAPSVYHRRILAYLEWLQDSEQEVSPDTLKAYLAFRTSCGMAPSTVRGDLFAIKASLLAMHDYLASAGNMADAEISRYTLSLGLQSIRLPRVQAGKRAMMVKGLSPEVVDRVIRHTTARRACIIEFLVDTGMRVSEMASLRVRSVRQYSRTFAFVSVVGKGGKERSLWVRMALVSRIKRLFKGKVYLFETAHGNPLDRKNVYEDVRSAFKKIAGISLSPHNMRHLHAMRMLRIGSPAQVARALGHASPSTTAQFYDADSLPQEAYAIRHHGNRGISGGKRNVEPANM